jgi:hypothetical protein
MNTNTTRTDSKKLSRLRRGAAALAGTAVLAIAGSVAPASAFADALQPTGSPTHQLAQHNPSMSIGWWIFLGGLTFVAAAGGIYLVRTLKKHHREHYLWFALAASWLVRVIGEVRAGKSFIFDLIAMIAAVYLDILYYRRNRQLKR